MTSPAKPPRGVLPYLQKIWPAETNLTDLYDAAGNELGVHWSTVYGWCKNGMASARAEHLHKVQQLCEARLGLDVPADLLFLPSTEQ